MELASLTKWVYDYGEGSREMRALLGGKGANVAEMTRVLGPGLVPPGFVITTEACVQYLRNGREPAGLDDAVRDALVRLEEAAGRRFGDPADPLLVSVRSGARDSMPGMLDTVLDVGLNDASVEGLAAVTGDERFAWDCYRRLVQMFGNVVLGVPGARFEDEIRALKRRREVRDDRELDAAALRELTRRFLGFVDLPAEPREQLHAAVTAVFESWRGPRAVAYRRLNRIPEEWGTAVNVQQMVFGNRGDRSGSGVAFSRDEITGAPEPSGDFLVDAQGEDVVSGVRTPRNLAELDDWMPGLHGRLCEILRHLERHYGDMQDTEFTVEDGRLYMLQTRSAKRHAHAALRFAVDAVEEGLLTREQAIATIDADRLDALLHPTFDPDAILVRPFTEAEDVAEFFSFGTNDLTQTALGFSRDDVEGRIIPAYTDRQIVTTSPFETIDVDGVGELVRTAVQRGRAARPGLVTGVCGEHGGDPASIRFFDAAGLDYVSCSPFRVPVARVAAAQAALPTHDTKEERP